MSAPSGVVAIDVSRLLPGYFRGGRNTFIASCMTGCGRRAFIDSAALAATSGRRPRGPPGEQPGGIDLGGQIGQRKPDAPVVDDGPTERLAPVAYSVTYTDAALAIPSACADSASAGITMASPMPGAAQNASSAQKPPHVAGAFGGGVT
jgi:hypothetical protein